MARHGITYEDVISAANSLKGEGKSITIENVRRFLGTGSAGTVNQHLRRWRQVQQSTQKIASKENLPEGLISLVKGLWEGVLAQSSEQFAPIESNYQQEIAELKAELEKYRSNNQRWQKMFNQWQQEKIAIANEKLTLEQALEFAHKENQSLHGKYDGLLQQLQEKQERIEELHRLHQQTQANLEHYRESVREQRLLDQQKFDQEKQQYSLDIKQLNEELALRKSHLLALQQESQILHQTNQRLEADNQQTQLKLDQLSELLNENEKAKTLFEKDSVHWQTECTHLKSKLKEKIDQDSAFQVEVKWLNQQLSDTKAQMDSLKDQNKLLVNDKWVLGQEKAQLEGQLKQLHKEIHV